ncbi:MAG: VWA domain-containing protein [Bacteroidales bacterium]|nr:VWA domain-containing protein [Bacteroidales bacterium]
MVRFEHTEFLYGLILVPLLWGIFLLYRYLWKRRMKTLGEAHLVNGLIPEYSGSRIRLRFWLLMIAMAMLVIALANPQTGSTLEKVERKGIEIMIALDVSNSMLAEDIQPSRLSRARQSISRLIDKLSNDRIGIVVFAGRAYTQLTITSDYAAAKMFLATVGPDLIPSQGTAIGDAINQSISAFSEREGSKAIIVITDGENHEDDALLAASEAAQKDIIVCTIGMGTPEGGAIPQYHGNLRVGFKKDQSGSTVVTRLNEVMLQQVAASGGGIYVRASNTDAGLEKVFNAINKLEKSSFDARIFSDYEDRFQIFLLIALVFLLIEMMIVERKSKWFSNFSIYQGSLFQSKSRKE